MQMTDVQRHELRDCAASKADRVVFASACGPLLYGFPHQNRYFDVRGVHLAAAAAMPCRGGLQETREWRESLPDCQAEWVSHEVGKFVRLLQMNNGGAYEQLFSPHVVVKTPAREELQGLAREMVSLQLYWHYRSFFQSQRKFFMTQADQHARHLLYLYRVALTGIHLMETGEILSDLGQLAQFHERVQVLQLLKAAECPKQSSGWRAAMRELDALDERLGAVSNRAKLPEQVLGRERAEAWLSDVRRTLEAGCEDPRFVIG